MPSSHRIVSSSIHPHPHTHTRSSYLFFDALRYAVCNTPPAIHRFCPSIQSIRQREMRRARPFAKELPFVLSLRSFVASLIFIASFTHQQQQRAAHSRCLGYRARPRSCFGGCPPSSSFVRVFDVYTASQQRREAEPERRPIARVCALPRAAAAAAAAAAAWKGPRVRARRDVSASCASW